MKWLGIILLALTGIVSSDDHDRSYELSSDLGYPEYKWEYEVGANSFGDEKSAFEKRVGDAVQGQYRVGDPDGYERVVDYTVGPGTGFQATVTRTWDGEQISAHERNQLHNTRPDPVQLENQYRFHSHVNNNIQGTSQQQVHRGPESFVATSYQNQNQDQFPNRFHHQHQEQQNQFNRPTQYRIPSLNIFSVNQQQPFVNNFHSSQSFFQNTNLPSEQNTLENIENSNEVDIGTSHDQRNYHLFTNDHNYQYFTMYHNNNDQRGARNHIADGQYDQNQVESTQHEFRTQNNVVQNSQEAGISVVLA